ncbi:hypothetical protein ACF07T_39735 [Streptomyces sp. NPDC015184]|uniref:hypothetical protein n=1 Tax=Streptomyces sp. NPDC015184 TaxID=3364946 RepID=UPI0036F60893
MSPWTVRPTVGTISVNPARTAVCRVLLGSVHTPDTAATSVRDRRVPGDVVLIKGALTRMTHETR